MKIKLYGRGQHPNRVPKKPPPFMPAEVPGHDRRKKRRARKVVLPAPATNATGSSREKEYGQ